MSEKPKYFDGFELYIEKIKAEHHFSFMKLNHFFWEYLSGKSQQKKIIADWGAEETCEEIHEFIKFFPSETNIILAVGIGGFDKAEHGTDVLLQTIRRTLPPHIEIHSATTFKRAFVSNKMNLFFDSIRDKRIVCVGLPHLKNLGLARGLKNYEHLPVKIDEIKRKDKLLEKINSTYRQGTFYLLQCGEILSSWLIMKLHQELKDCTILDIGKALDYKLDVFTSEEDELLYKQLGGKKPLIQFIRNAPWTHPENWDYNEN